MCFSRAILYILSHSLLSLHWYSFYSHLACFYKLLVLFWKGPLPQRIGLVRAFQNIIAEQGWLSEKDFSIHFYFILASNREPSLSFNRSNWCYTILGSEKRARDWAICKPENILLIIYHFTGIITSFISVPVIQRWCFLEFALSYSFWNWNNSTTLSFFLTTIFKSVI